MTAPRNKRRLRVSLLGRIAEKVMAPSLRARGFTRHRLIARWPEIAGPAAGWSEPQSIAFPPRQTTHGTLTVNVESGRGPEMQMLLEDIIKNCNAVFGYPALARITITQRAMRAAMRNTTRPAPATNPPEKPGPGFSVPENASLSEDLRKIFNAFGKSPPNRNPRP